ncbi:MAG: carboxypeptidase-like regulatory domain-containing protein [Kofleriaceae bacterium]
MKKLLVVVILAACGSSHAPAPAPPSNVVRGPVPTIPQPPKAATAVFTSEIVPGGSDPKTGTIRGVAFDAAKQPMVGGTFVVVSPVLQGEQVVISDESGAFTIEKLPPGHYQIVIYYNDGQRGFDLDVEASKITTARLTNWPTEAPPPETIEVHLD